jgi:MerR family transcriptional regulator, light-induced transcriptional regulator
MASYSQSPVYNLSAVLKETGLKADVLRAWERRYDLPMPRRTPGGHRLYSDYDIETVKWLKARQAEGLSISRAVDLWKEVVSTGRDPLGNPTSASSTSNTRIERLRAEWLAGCMGFDSVRAEQALNQAFAIYPVETVCTAILQQGLSEIGQAWMVGEITAQQEHFASALAVRRIETLITATPPPTRPQMVLVGCPPGEWHTFSSLLLSLFLRRKGWQVVYLGADAPIEEMEHTATAVHPNLIILAAQQLTTVAAIRSAAYIFLEQGISLAYGGLIFNRIPRLCDRIPAHFLGRNLEEALGLAEQLLLSPPPHRQEILKDDPYQGLAPLFFEKRPLIEHAVYQNYKEAGTISPQILDAITFLGNELTAALELGDLTFLDTDLEWVQLLLAGRKLPVGPLFPFLKTYDQAVCSVLGDAGQPVSDWLGTYIRHSEQAIKNPERR